MSLLNLVFFLVFFSVIAAVKNEHSAEELSTPYKKVLMGQIQQQLQTVSLNPLPSDSFDTNGLPPLPNSASGDDSVPLSQDSALSHRKKAVPCKYVASGADRTDVALPPTDITDGENYEGDLSIDEAEADSMSQSYASSIDQGKYGEGAEDGGPANETVERLPEGDNTQTVNGQVASLPKGERVDDVISAISERAEAVGTTGERGSVIAQVISGLLDANKYGSNNNSIPATHRQSIST